jgi:hypothetical protein
MIQIPVFNQFVYQIESVDFANPGLGVGWSHTIADNNLRSIISMNWTFITSAAAANRFVQLLLRNGAGGFFHLFAYPIAILASETVTFSAFPCTTFQQHTVAIGSAVIPIPLDLTLSPADIINIVVVGIQAGDQVFGPTIQFKIWRTEP